MSTYRAPGRVNLIGEHTDYNDGFVLPLAIEQGCTARVGIRDDDRLVMSSAQEEGTVELELADLRPGVVDDWAAYVAGVVWAMRADGADLPGLTITVDGDVPSGAGLSSSAALVCSVGAAVADAAGLDVDRERLVALTRRAENDFVGAPTGGMDQLISVMGQAGHVLFCDMRSLETQPVPFDPDAAGLSLLVIDTRAPHRHADGEYGARRRDCERAAQLLAGPLDLAERSGGATPALRDVTIDDLPAVERILRAATPGDDTLLRRARHVVTEDDRVLRTVAALRDGDLGAGGRTVGELLTASHDSMRDDFEITVPEVDVAVRSALDGGALGARMTGGGFGGCVIALTADPNAVADSVRSAYAEHGFGAPSTFTARPAAGVHAAD